MYSYGDDDLNRTEVPDEKESGDEDSRESNSVSLPAQSSLLGFWLSLTDGSCRLGLDLQMSCWHFRDILWLVVLSCFPAPAG